jgi:tetratricopeptide (TPR) repeat protein
MKTIGDPEYDRRDADRADTLRRLYPPMAGFAVRPLAPDRLAEALVRRVCSRIPPGERRGRYLADALALAGEAREEEIRGGLSLVLRARGCTSGAVAVSSEAATAVDDALSTVAHNHTSAVLPVLTRLYMELPRTEPLVPLMITAAAAADARTLERLETILSERDATPVDMAVVVYDRLLREAAPAESDATTVISRRRRFSLALEASGRFDEALTANAAALDACLALDQEAPARSVELRAQIHADRMLLAVRVERPGEAMTAGREAIRHYESLYERDPQFGRPLAAALNTQSLLYAAAGRITDAEQASGRALAVLQAVDADAWETAPVRFNRGDQLARLGRIAEALTFADDASSIYHRLWSRQPGLHAESYAKALLMKATLSLAAGPDRREGAVRSLLRVSPVLTAESGPLVDEYTRLMGILLRDAGADSGIHAAALGLPSAQWARRGDDQPEVKTATMRYHTFVGTRAELELHLTIHRTAGPDSVEYRLGALLLTHAGVSYPAHPAVHRNVAEIIKSTTHQTDQHVPVPAPTEKIHGRPA